MLNSRCCSWGKPPLAAAGVGGAPSTVYALAAGKLAQDIFHLGMAAIKDLLHVRDANGQALAFVYCEDEPGRRTTGKLLTRDEAWRIAANIAKLPELLLKRP